MKLRLLLFLCFLFYPSFLHSHVNHYNNIKLIEMDILRNGKKIGYNNYNFRSQGDILIVKNEIQFNAKFVGVSLLNIDGFSTETYKDGKLLKFNSSTIQNKKKKYNDLKFIKSKKKFRIKGSSYNGQAPSDAMIGNWWNHNILQSKKIISPLSGSVKFQEVYFLSKEVLKIDENIYNTSRFRIELKKNINDIKREEFYVWLDDKSKIILKVAYSKLGNWQYVVKNIEKFN
tara:strand:- start:377 stop:1066 length:690 start_codon:yes stop_codon:yes gene_type:complete